MEDNEIALRAIASVVEMGKVDCVYEPSAKAEWSKLIAGGVPYNIYLEIWSEDWKGESLLVQYLHAFGYGQYILICGYILLSFHSNQDNYG